MLDILIKFVMNLVITIVEAIFSPFLSALFLLFPSVEQYFSYITSFLAQGFTFVSTILHWLLFNSSMFGLLFDYFVIKYTIHLLIITIQFSLNIYNKLKP